MMKNELRSRRPRACRLAVVLGFAFALPVAASGGLSAQAQTLTDEAKVQAVLKNFAYPLMSSIWPAQDGRVPIYVCWENPETSFQSQMASVKAAVTASWQKNSRVEFKGWQKCTQTNRGVRISIQDVGPETKNLGRFIDGVKNGMVLNFTFNNWGQSCKSSNMYDLCVKSIAVHEFGHALGFSHEQNRPDTPGECMKEPQGPNGDTQLTPWDWASVMNYCNSVDNNNGVLSAYDTAALQRIYGVPK